MSDTLIVDENEQTELVSFKNYLHEDEPEIDNGRAETAGPTIRLSCAGKQLSFFVDDILIGEVDKAGLRPEYKTVDYSVVSSLIETFKTAGIAGIREKFQIDPDAKSAG